MGGVPATSETIDKAAALYHMHDLVDEGDSLEVIVPPRGVPVRKLTSSPSPVRGYAGVVSFTSPAPAPAAAPGRATDLNGGGGSRTSKSTCHFLLVRLEAHETDLVVFFTVPHVEFDLRADSRGLSQEEELASETIEKWAQELEIKDWGLFA